jgi:hypothetical protein
MNSLNQLDKELDELKSFIADLKADRPAQKAKEQREAWTKYTSLSLVFVAVFAAIATQWSGKYSGRAMTEMNNSILDQAKASDKWSYYQAKSIKQNLYEALREVAPNGARADTNSTQSLEAFNTKVTKYKADEASIMAEAQKLEEMQCSAQASALRASAHAAGNGMGNSHLPDCDRSKLDLPDYQKENALVFVHGTLHCRYRKDGSGLAQLVHFCRTGSICQMRSQYSRIARSEEK